MPTKTPRRATGGRFARRYSDQDLLAFVRQVIAAGEFDDPQAISERVYDRARVTAGRADTPRAGWIAKRLKTPWPRVVEIARAKKGAEIAIGTRREKRLRDEISQPEIVHYLQMVARHLDSDQMTVGDYDQGRRELIEADNRRYRNGGRLGRLIPTGQMIVHTAGSWAKALAWAGLKAPTSRKVPLYPAERALDDFIADYGFVPSRQTLDRYQHARRMATKAIRADQFTAWRRQELATGLASRHGLDDSDLGRRGCSPDFSKASPAPAGYASRGTRAATMEMVKADLNRALDLSEGPSLSQREYQHLAATHGLVALGTIQRVGRDAGGLTWGQIRDQVIAERARGC